MSEVVTANVELMGGMQFEATAGSGHELTLDAGVEYGGVNQGFRPMELLLVSLGGCTGFDVISILRKMKMEVSGYEIRLKGERAADHPKVYQKIQIEHVFHGRNLEERLIERAIKLSMNTYCSAAAMLSKTAAIETSYRIEAAD